MYRKATVGVRQLQREGTVKAVSECADTNHFICGIDNQTKRPASASNARALIGSLPLSPADTLFDSGPWFDCSGAHGWHDPREGFRSLSARCVGKGNVSAGEPVRQSQQFERQLWLTVPVHVDTIAVRTATTFILLAVSQNATL